jgi:hypothetical protein
VNRTLLSVEVFRRHDNYLLRPKLSSKGLSFSKQPVVLDDLSALLNSRAPKGSSGSWAKSSLSLCSLCFARGGPWWRKRRWKVLEQAGKRQAQEPAGQRWVAMLTSSNSAWILTDRRQGHCYRTLAKALFEYSGKATLKEPTRGTRDDSCR